MDPITGTLISGGVKLLGGLFGGKSKSPTPRKNLLSQAQGAREASEQYGFNPLTMLQYGQPGGAMGAGGVPPLASSDLILGALQDVSDVVTGEAAQRAEANRLELELGRRKLDAVSGLLAVSPSAAATVGDGLPTIGRRAAMAVTPSTQLRFPEAFNAPVALKAGDQGGVAVPTARYDRGTGALLEGQQLEATPGWSPASVWENDYGDVGQAGYGLAKLMRDIGYTAELKNKRYREKHTVGEPLDMRDGYNYPPGTFAPPPKSVNPWFSKKSPFRLFGTASF